jgi:hypothetical protein
MRRHESLDSLRNPPAFALEGDCDWRTQQTGKLLWAITLFSTVAELMDDDPLICIDDLTSLL